MSATVSSAMVLGAGTMGAGIAELLAKARIDTSLYDVSDEIVEAALGRVERSLGKAVDKGKLDTAAAEAARARVRGTTDLEGAAGADLVVEAVPERMELKTLIFAEISAGNDSGILATNTSSLSVTEIAAAAERPERVLGLHFFNPAPIMPLLEIVRAEQTSDDALDRALALADRLGKSPIVVTDSPGFATSRLGLVIGLEAMRMLESGVASAADIDRAMELGYRHPMGPLKLTDLVGLDVRLAIADHLTREIGAQFTAPPLLRRLVRAGKLGKKTGEGFYRWEGHQAVAKD